MSPPERSIFDLSDAEKLQLVQDLWDDLASTPESVPVYDWQKEELEGEGRTCSVIPHQQFDGQT